MNQILSTKINKVKKSKIFSVQFSISIFAIIIFLVVLFFYKLQLNEDNEKSTTFSNNYEIYKLYAKQNEIINYQDSDILGYISIPKLNINYPFFYGYNEELLKISPCRFYGDMPPTKGNLCITAHNYNDNRFFGRIAKLNNGEKIIIEDNNGKRYFYTVFQKFEVTENDISPLENYDKNSYTLTLITCNNFNKNRIIIQAIQ